MQPGPVPRPSWRRRTDDVQASGIHGVHPNNQIADLAENLGICIHLTDGPYHHVLRDAHTVYLFGSYTPLRDMSETERVTEVASSLSKELLLCDVTRGQWNKRAPSDQSFTHLHGLTFPVLHPRSAVLVVPSLPLHHKTRCHHDVEYHRSLRLDDYRTFDEYLRERIRRGLQAHRDHTEMLLHLQDQYRETYKRYKQELVQRDRPEQ